MTMTLKGTLALRTADGQATHNRLEGPIDIKAVPGAKRPINGTGSFEGSTTITYTLP